MTERFCPDCGVTPVSPRRPGKDGRCDWCRSQVGHRRHSTVRTGRRYAADVDELRSRYGGESQ